MFRLVVTSSVLPVTTMGSSSVATLCPRRTSEELGARRYAAMTARWRSWGSRNAGGSAESIVRQKRT